MEGYSRFFPQSLGTAESCGMLRIFPFLLTQTLSCMGA
jgi:hypothetical protein